MGQQLGLCVEGSFQFALYGCVAVFYHFSIQELSFVIVTAFCCLSSCLIMGGEVVIKWGYGGLAAQ